MDAIEQFKGAMRAHGLTPPEIISDGQLHRFSSNGRRGDDAGWYLLHDDGIPAGCFGDWRTGFSHTWRADIGRDLTPAELAAHQARVDAARRAREAEEARRHAEAARNASSIWKTSTPASASHPYLARKQVEPVESLRDIDAAEAARILGYAPKSGNEDLAGRLLVVPVAKVAGELSTLELIDEAGRKSAIYGGTKSSGHWVAQPLPDGDGAGLTLLIGEGVATVLSAREATGHLVIAALSSGNLLAVTREMRKRFPAAKLGILADLVKATGDPDPHAIKAARAVGGRQVIPDFGPDRLADWTDFNDMHQLQGREMVAECIRRQMAAGEGRAAEDEPEPGNGAEGAPGSDSQDKDGGSGEDATAHAENLEATVRRLAALSPIEYDRIRLAEADALGVRVATLDAEVSKMRPATGGVDGQGAVPLFAEVDPWPHPVNGADLLKDLATAFLRYVFMPLQASTILALWVVHTFCYDLRRCTPILGLTSPQKRCGKTTLMSLLLSVANRPLAASNISPSCVFRAIDLWHPTLLIDEADSFLRDNEELRGILNSGHTRELAYVLRASGEEHEPRQFSTWAPKALALIGKLPTTLHDRAIVVELARKTPGERVERLQDFDGADLRRRCLRWAEDHAEEIKAADPSIPAGTHDRAADNWAPLLAIADVAGGGWSERARQALAAQPDEPDDSKAVMLLADIQQFFEEGRKTQKVFSEDLALYLAGLEDRPWAEWGKGKKPISKTQIAGLLRQFKIRPGTKRQGKDTFKGYYLESFEDAFSRYLPPVTPERGG